MIDHDDTTVDSTPSIHHPAHIEQMKRLGRSHQALNLEDWFKINFNPGLVHYFKETLTFTEEENKLCYSIWRDFTTKRAHPPFFPGMLKLLNRFRSEGGIIVVVSHSEPDIIKRHYMEQTEFQGLFPDRIFGWNGNPEENKPGIWPVTETLKQFNLKKKDILMVDDLKPGITMAQTAGIDSAGVGWSQSHKIPEIKADLFKECTYYFSEIKDLEDLIFN